MTEYVWWAGILLTVCSEVGNFAAYGDPGTPSAVIASLGCVSVISNLAISVFYLKVSRPTYPPPYLATFLRTYHPTYIPSYRPTYQSTYHSLLTSYGLLLITVLLTTCLILTTFYILLATCTTNY